MTIEERLEQAEKLVADVKAELAAMRAEKATKRNWPERIEAGMVFQSPGTTATWMATDVDGLFVCLKGETDSFKAAGRTMRLERDNVPHAGHARDILAIRTDAHEPVEGIDEQRQKYANASEYYAAARAPKAHEPTGAELVGRMCEFADLMSGPWSPGECAAFGQNPAYPYRKAGGAEWKFARLAK